MLILRLPVIVFVIDIQQLNFVRFIFIRLKLVAIVIMATVSPPVSFELLRVVFAHQIHHLLDVAKKGLFVRGIAIAHILEITNDDETDSKHHNINFVRTLCISVYFVTYDELYLTVTRFVDFPFINKLSYYRLLCVSYKV